jgi:hypothetical protein
LSGRGWIPLAVIVGIAMLLIFAQNTAASDSPQHSSLSDGRNGTSALVQLASRQGRPVQTVGLTFSLPSPPATVFVFDPEPFSPGEASSLVNWVRSGGTLVYADDGLDTRLAVAFDLHKSGPAPVLGEAVTPALAGVRQVGDDSFSEPYRPTPAQAVLLQSRTSAALALEERIGSGRVLALASPELVSNGWLTQYDNAVLAADLVSLTPGPVAFDEFHHGLGANGGGDWTSTPLGEGLFAAALAIFLGLLLRGRAFGPRVALPSGAGRSAADYTAAVGNLLRRAGGRELALQVVFGATRRSLAARVGLASDMPLDRLEEVMARRAPAVAADFQAVKVAAATTEASERGLLATARRLHDLAYPMARK